MADVLIQSTSNDQVKWVRRLQSRRRARQQEGVFVAEGRRWANAVLSSGRNPSQVFYTADDPDLRRLAERLSPDPRARHPVNESVMRAMSATETPPGLLLVVDRPELQPPPQPALGLVVDGLSDPGNLGTLLRTSLAAGVDVIWLLPGTVDPFNPKCVRGGMGAQLYLPLQQVTVDQLRAAVADQPLWLLDAGGEVNYLEVDWRQPCALVVGSEARGPRPELLQLAAGAVHIPMQAGAESLNAAIAAAITLYEIRRQRDHA